MMAGARVAMTTSALLVNGIGYVRKLVSELHDWLEDHEYESISQMQGSMSARKVMNPSAFERGNYMRVLGSYTTVGAGKA
jgi:dihydroorotate dehydrogenase (fumarate)